MGLNKLAIKHKSRAGRRRAARAGLRRKINDKCIARHHETSRPDAAASCTLNGRRRCHRALAGMGRQTKGERPSVTSPLCGSLCGGGDR